MTRAERVIDVSVLAAALFDEARGEEARSLLRGCDLIAPAHVFAEMTSVAAKKVWLGLADLQTAAEALQSTADFLKEVVDMQGLSASALKLSAEHRISAYDALYLSLAAQRNSRVITFDGRLIRAARTAGLSHLVA